VKKLAEAGFSCSIRLQSSASALDAPYGEMLAFSGMGYVSDVPYTAGYEAKTTRSAFNAFADSRTFNVPVTLTSVVNNGSITDS